MQIDKSLLTRPGTQEAIESTSFFDNTVVVIIFGILIWLAGAYLLYYAVEYFKNKN